MSPSCESTLFEAVQGKLAAQAVARRCRLRGSRAILSGRLFDSSGNRMSPSHTNKRGVRYRYYVSQAVLQGKPQTAGSVGRVPAAELEAFVITALRKHLSASAPGEQPPENDLEILEHHLERVTLTLDHLELRMRQTVECPESTANEETHQRSAWPTSRRSPSPGQVLCRRLSEASSMCLRITPR